jgi:hypothetical protein
VVATGIESAIGAKREPIIRKISSVYESKQISRDPSISQMPKEHIENNTVATIPKIQKQKEDLAEENKEEIKPNFQSVVSPTNTPEDLIHAESQITKNSVRDEAEVEQIPTFLSSENLQEDAFIPDEPASAVQLEKNIDPFAAADMVNANKEAKTEGTEKRNSGLSLFERVTGVGRSQKKQNQEIEDISNDQPNINNNQKSLSSTHESKEPKDENISDEGSNRDTGGLVNQESKEDYQETEDYKVHKNAQDDMDMPNIDDDLDETETIPESPDVENNSEHDNLLGGLNASDRIKASSVDDDILDIPAFLRRQAN